jgi:hypothetical protein
MPDRGQQVIKNSEQDDLNRLSAYAPTRLGKNDVKNSSGMSLRLFSFCFAVGLHAIFLWFLYKALPAKENFLPEEIVTLLYFLPPAPKPKPDRIEIMPVMHVVNKSAATPLKTPEKKPLGQEFKANKQPVEKKFSAEPLKLYTDTGRVSLPVDFIEKYDQSHPLNKRFDFQNPNLELAGTFLKRPPAMDFNPTQFEDAWKPDQDILTELLEKAVEKTTKEIKIPVPGNPAVKLVCQVSVLAMGGGCGFVPNGGYGRVIPDNEDDPKTLSPEEDKQCQAWWDKINNTKSQREWLKTKELYEITCKKPLAKEKIKLP